MGLLSRVVNADRKTNPSPIDPYWYGPLSRAVASQETVTEQTALNYSACWAATRIICEPVSCLPAQLRRRRTNGFGSDLVTDHPIAQILANPNPDQTWQTFAEQMTQWAVNWGYAIAWRSTDSAGRLIGLVPIHPTRIPPSKIENGEDGRREFHIQSNDGVVIAHAEDVFVLPGLLSETSIIGQGVIARARESIGMGLATEKFGAKFFGNSAIPKVILSHPGLLDEHAQKRLTSSWSKALGGDNSHSTMVIEEGMKVETITIPPEDAQFLGTREYNLTEFARWYQVPVHRLAKLDRATHTNIEHENLTFIQQSLMTWIRRWESEIRRQLMSMSEQRQLFVKFRLQSLMRGDSQSRSEFYSALSALGVLSIDEIRELEDMNPIGTAAGGDLRTVRPGFTRIEDVVNPPDQSQPQPAIDGDDIDDMRATLSHILDHVEMLELPADEWGNDRDAKMDALMSRIEDAATKAIPDESPMVDRAVEIARSTIQTIIQDLVEFECRSIERAQKTDDFAGWIARFYNNRFYAAIDRQIANLSGSMEIVGLHVPDQFAGDFIESAIHDVTNTDDVSALVSHWRESRAACIVKDLCDAETSAA